MEPHIHGNSIQQRWFESKAMGKVLSGLGWHYKPVGEDRLLNGPIGNPYG